MLRLDDLKLPQTFGVLSAEQQIRRLIDLPNLHQQHLSYLSTADLTIMSY